MPTRSAHPALFEGPEPEPITHDELERRRVQLEHNLQHTDLSLHLSSPDLSSDVEMGRHMPNRSPSFSPFSASFGHPSGDDFDTNEQSRFQAWSHHTEEGIDPYAAQSLSTAAHHASMLTLSAGLGGRAQRRDMSFSGAEYDPDRPLHGITAGITDPFRALQPQEDSRPRLADALSHITFSPKRPRSAQGLSSPRMANITLRTSTPNRSAASRNTNSHNLPELELRVQPATPSIRQSLREQGESSRFTAKANKKLEKTTHAATSFKKNVQLPDVTGLTSAIASPAKVDVEFYGYDPKDTTETEARLIATLSVVQSKLSNLEVENSVSRRRVRELEMELEACKKEVARERTRIMEHEQSMREEERPGGKRRVLSQRERMQQQQQKKKAEEDQAELAAAEARYLAAVEEKKSLEALINHLRIHLTRLTTELSEHQQLLHELRLLRDSDARALAVKSKEIDKLRQEVERLAGEVGALRGVVEEGLRERRISREQSSGRGQESASDSGEQSSGEENESEEEESLQTPQVQVHSLPPQTEIQPPASANGNVSKPFLDMDEVSRITQEVEERRSERSIQSQSRSQDDSQSHPGSTSQEASQGWSRQPNPTQSRKVSRSGSPSMMFEPEASGSAAPNSPLHQLEHSVRFARELSRAESSRPSSPSANTTEAQVESQPRPGAPTPAAALRSGANSQKRRVQTAPQHPMESPFPQIRGEHLERLFFSAPEHNAETCTVCHRRRRRRPEEVEQATSWLRDHERVRVKRQKAQDDEGLVEGPEEERESNGRAAKAVEDKRANRVPPQTVLTRVLRELEDDFTHYKSIYVELADQYKDMDPVSNVVKRNVLADHLREVIDILEQKGNQIASLYDLLMFKDKPVSESVVPDRSLAASRTAKSTGPSSLGRAQARRYLSP